jgi:hypothetical protein
LPLAFGVWHFVRAGRLSPLAALGALVLGASYQVWAGIGHRLRARGRPAA